MYLESLELQGFKSFPDKIKLEFDKGLTAVVGPNGSGKSNIGDAVRWVLGEQSTKTLRGAKMEDVIFAGTQSRKAVGFAQVTLNIRNDKGILQIPSEEVSVTRKLYRSGESEYRINGSQVRLKDIYELFMDTGLGRDGYSIIGQGRVAEIVSAKSNERREIFEEAAGISKFRYKKAEAERKLDAAQENILRLKDIIAELESRVEPLRIQSEKAAKFIELSERKKILEITIWMVQLGELKKKLEELEEKILINTTQYNTVDSDVVRLEAEQQKLYTESENCTLKAEQLRNEILEAERSSTQLHSDIAVYENDIEHCNHAITDIKNQQEHAKNSDLETTKLINEKLEKVKTIEVEIEQARIGCNQLEEELGGIVSKQECFDKDYSAVNTLLNQLYIKQSEYNIALTSGKTNKAEAEEQLAQVRIQNEILRTELEKLEKEKSDTTEGISLTDEHLAEYTNRMSGLSRLYEGKTQKLSAAKKQFEDITFDIREKDQRIKLLTDLENSMEGFANSVKQILKAGKIGQIKGIHGSVAQLINVDSEYSVAIETALGAALQNVIVENEDTAKRGIRLLQEMKAGRATFLPITSVKGNKLNENGLESCDGFVALAVDLIKFDSSYTGIFNSLLGRIAIAEDIDSATLIAKKYGYKFRIVTLDGQIINAGGSFTGGSTSRSSGVLTRKNEIDSLKIQRDKLSEKQSELKIITEKMQAETDKLSFDIEDAKEQIRTIEQDKIRFDSELKRIESVSAQTLQQIKATDEQSDRFRKKLEEIDSVSKNTEVSLLECEKQIAENEKLVSDSETQKTELHSKREEISSAISDMKIREMSLAKDKEVTQNEIRQLEEQAKALGDNSADLVLQLDEQQKLIAEKQKLIEERKKALTGSADKVAEINSQILLQHEAKREIDRKSNEGRIKIRELSEEKEKFSREMTRLEERKISVSSNYDSIINDMSEQYNIYISEAEKIAEPVEDMLVSQRDLAEIKQKIRSLGSVNVAAIEEYKEVSERYEFMSGQLNDVESSKRELEKLIDELTDTMRKQFSESFNMINENFKTVFVELFGGGKAELTLTDSDDVLEAGIEINVAPPGKVIKSLSLLSGGEQAFVAIAIYFSILKIKPAPFCILDEIEAALDDVNVTKYAQYLRRFTDTTQFILVTHRRGTMEEADVMYGVTMQQKGISKLLKLEQPPRDTAV